MCLIRALDERPSMFIREKSNFSSERMLHKDYDRKGSVERIYDRDPQGVCVPR
jgi:hypothetical protein